MDYFYGAIDPISSIGSPLLKSEINSSTAPQDVSKEFMSIFMAEMLKPIFKNQLLAEEENSFYGGLPGSGISNEILINQLAGSLVGKEFLPSYFSK